MIYMLCYILLFDVLSYLITLYNVGAKYDIHMLELEGLLTVCSMLIQCLKDHHDKSCITQC